MSLIYSPISLETPGKSLNYVRILLIVPPFQILSVIWNNEKNNYSYIYNLHFVYALSLKVISLSIYDGYIFSGHVNVFWTRYCLSNTHSCIMFGNSRKKSLRCRHTWPVSNICVFIDSFRKMAVSCFPLCPGVIASFGNTRLEKNKFVDIIRLSNFTCKF